MTDFPESWQIVPRPRMSTRRRRHIFFENKGICEFCKEKIKPAIERWEIIHLTAFVLTNYDSNPNCRPAHYECHKRETGEVDIPTIRKVERIYNKHNGFHASSRPMAGGRDDRWRRRMNGKTERRR